MRSRSYFTAPDLADIGRALDAQERLIAGKASGKNYDDTGYFSIQPNLKHNVMTGYSVFVVRGSLSTSAADRRVLRLPIPGEAQSAQPKAFSGYGYSLKGENSVNNSNDDDDDEETLLAKAIEASLQDTRPNDMDEIRRKRLARFGG
ncbi:hypothetical protein DFQ30_004082 [Apophysomyces sp. BC1015]|nr:hypothetical protein DFQ30_004082 [Apophysomyces sp. BC1015]